jgi:two-component system NtrC family response regulator
MKTHLRDSSVILTALSVSPRERDHRFLKTIFDDSKWMLYTADCLPSALSLLYRHDIGVVLCERDLLGNTWTDMLDRLMVLRDAPPLIVTSRLADDRLWAEALNRGAYDVLAKPFEQQEVVRVVDAAWHYWNHSLQGSSERKAMTALGA